jgi:hypothetical protein
MKLLRQQMVVIAAAAMMGSAQVGATNYDLGTLSPTVSQQANFFAASGASGAYSFADIFNFSIGADQRTLLTSAVNYAPSGTSVGATHVTDLTVTIYGGSDGTGSVLGTVSSSNGSLIDYSNLLAAGSFSAKVSGLADGSVGGGYNFSIAAVPEPSEWMMLLAGLMVVGFMARRKTSLVTG